MRVDDTQIDHDTIDEVEVEDDIYMLHDELDVADNDIIDDDVHKIEVDDEVELDEHDKIELVIIGDDVDEHEFLVV